MILGNNLWTEYKDAYNKEKNIWQFLKMFDGETIWFFS